MAIVRAEFTVYPFQAGEALPPHVQAAVDAIRERGLTVEVEPLGNVVRGDAEVVLDALRAAGLAAVRSGATRIVLSLEAEG